jgi:hypothetical protein
MSTVIRVEIPDDTQRKIDKFQHLSGFVPVAIKRGMDYALSIVRGRIQRDRLSGKGPFPPDEHRLGIVSQQLQRSLREEPATIDGNTVTGTIGSPVFYGALHEYGWSGTVVRGQPALPGFSKIVGGVTSYHMTIPERRPVGTGLEENADFIVGEIGNAIDNLLEETAK